MKELIRIDENGWARCGNCSHKLFRIESDSYDSDKLIGIEIKCHSCKSINVFKEGENGK